VSLEGVPQIACKKCEMDEIEVSDLFRYRRAYFRFNASLFQGNCSRDTEDFLVLYLTVSTGRRWLRNTRDD
jgi:hypothetical protein